MDDSGFVAGDPAKPGRISVVSPRGDTGLYRIQVLCTNPAGCNGISGKLYLKAFDNRRTIPFTIQNSVGHDLAVMRVRKQILRY